MSAASNVIACPHCGKRNRVPAAAGGVPRCANCHNPLPWIATADDESFAEVVDASPKTPARFAVQAIPTLLVMSGGDVKARRAGAVSAAIISQWVTDTIGAGGSGT